MGEDPLLYVMIGHDWDVDFVSQACYVEIHLVVEGSVHFADWY